MIGLLLYIYITIFGFSLACIVCYLRLWWFHKGGQCRYGSKNGSRREEYEYGTKGKCKRIRSSYAAGGFEVESSVSSSQGTTTLIVHNTSMGLISEEIEEDLRRLKSMDSDNSGFVIMYTVPPPPPKHDPVKDKKDVFWERCKLKNVRNAKKQSSSEHIFIRVEDYDEMQNTREAEVNLKGNLDLPMGEEPSMMEYKPMPSSARKFSLKLRSKDSEILV